MAEQMFCLAKHNLQGRGLPDGKTAQPKERVMNYYGVYFCLLAMVLLVVSIFVIWQSNSRPNTSLIMKMASSAGFTILGLFALLLCGDLTFSKVCIVAGLVFSIFGDVILGCVNDTHYNRDNVIRCGMVSFALAQVCYFTALSRYAGFSWWSLLIGLVLTLAIVFGDKPLKLNYGNLKPFVMGYSFTLACSVGASVMTMIQKGFSAGTLLLLIGMVLFFLSDLVLAFIYFRKEKPSLVIVNLSLYYVAQIILATAIMYM